MLNDFDLLMEHLPTETLRACEIFFFFSGDPFFKFDLNYFLSCVYNMRSAGKKKFLPG